MKKVNFIFGEKTYELNEENCSELINDLEQPVSGIDIAKVLELLSQQEQLEFDREYYDQPCENCLAGKEEKAKYFPFLVYQFFIYTKKGDYVMTNISPEYANTSFTRLQQQGKIDNSYMVNVIVCNHCGEFTIEIEQCEV